MRLFEINFKEHQIFNDLKIKFTQSFNQSTDIYTTVIIGPNGTGKSLLLREICRIFKDMRGRTAGAYQKRVLEYDYFLRFYANNVLNEVVDDGGKRTYLVDGKRANLYDWHFPSRIVAVSTIVNDKFIFSSGDGFYKYAGIRSSNNNAGTKSLIKQNIQLLAECSYEKIMNIIQILKYLNFEDYFCVSYEYRYYQSLVNFEKNITAMDDFFLKWQERSKRTTIPFSYNNYQKLSESEKEKIIAFINKNLKNTKNLGYNIINETEHAEFKNDIEVINYLSKLDLINAPEIILKKKDYINDMSISSGEYNIIFQFLRILLNVEDDCLLLIDEPESSLHPNWQIMYLEMLYKCLENYKGVHVIIATHSHLLISNMKKDNSTILTVNDTMAFEQLEYSVSGWSPENILYNVFNLTSYRNYYFELDIRKLIKLLEDKESKDDSIKKIVIKLNRFKLKEGDPLLKIIDEANKRISND